MDVNQLPSDEVSEMRQFDSEEEDSDSAVYMMPRRDPLKIKLKLSDSSSEQSPTTRTCDFCGREFANGKALGGHIRIHNRDVKNSRAGASRVTDILKQRSNLRLDVPSRSGRSEGLEKLTCTICNREFPSEKSLFGHMRFHPERTYRGALPPSSGEPSRTSSYTSEESDQVLDNETESYREVFSSTAGGNLLKDLPNWSKTDKRGRQSTSEVARFLMGLSSMGFRARADDFPPAFSSRMYKPESPMKKPKMEDLGSVEKSKGKHVQVQALVTRNRGRPRKESKLNSVQAEEADRAKSGPEQNARRVRFQCSTCGRIFSTFQALGGHRSSHNKEKEKESGASTSQSRQTRSNSPGPVVEASASTEMIAAEAGAASGRARKEEAGPEPITPDAPNGIHRCGICNRIFRSGQALGGHKRCHSAATVGVQSEQGDHAGQSSLVPRHEPSPGDQASGVGTKILGFDLNKPPPADDEEGSESGLNCYPPSKPRARTT